MSEKTSKIKECSYCTQYSNLRKEIVNFKQNYKHEDLLKYFQEFYSFNEEFNKLGQFWVEIKSCNYSKCSEHIKRANEIVEIVRSKKSILDAAKIAREQKEYKEKINKLLGLITIILLDIAAILVMLFW